MKKPMQKLTALALSLLLSLSLALPALAYEDTDPPLWKGMGYDSLQALLDEGWISEEDYYQYAADEVEHQRETQAWIDAHPDEYAAFDPYAYFEGEFYHDYYGSPQAYMDAYQLTQEQFAKEMSLAWADGQIYLEQAQRELADFIAAHPDEYAAFDPYAYFEENLSYYHSPQQYMQERDLTEEDFRQEMLQSWMYDVVWQESQQAQLRQEKLDAGGSPDGINVMVNGRCVPFADVRPELENDRTMVPLAAVMEYLGAQVSYDGAADAAVVTLDGRTLRHQLNTDVISVTQPDGGVSSLTMDVPSYTRDGRTMVPLAFFAQALGYEVDWDEEYETAVLLDPDALARRIDGQFTLLNRLLYTLVVHQAPQEQTLQQTGRLQLDLTMLDSLNGDQHYSMFLDADSLVNQSALNSTITADLGGLVDLMKAEGAGYFLDQEELDQLREALSQFSVEIIADADSDTLYLRSPLISQFVDEFSGDVWVTLPAEGLLQGLTHPTAPTVGSLLAQTAVSSYWLDFYTWQRAVQTADSMSQFAGDDQFVRSGSSYTLTWTLDSLLRLMQSDEDWSYYTDELDNVSFRLNLKITPDGQGCSFSMSLDSASSDFAVDMALSGDTRSTDLQLKFHIKNTVKGDLAVTVRIAPTAQQPKTGPGEGESVISPTNFLGESPVEF